MIRRTVSSPIGEICLAGTADALVELRLPTHPREADAPGRSPALDLAELELAQYFAGDRTEFTVPVELRGTPFQLEVWNALRNVGFGELRSYLEIAEAIGRPAACRAVGAANGRNPVPIIVPCHRVIGADGSLTGYGGGLPAKQWLLAHEGAEPLQRSLL